MTIESYITSRLIKQDEIIDELRETVARLREELERLNYARIYVAEHVRGENYSDLRIDSEYHSEAIKRLLDDLELPAPYELGRDPA